MVVDARNNAPHYLRESASQTAGPYVHIGLAPGAAGFKIFENELGWDIAGPNAKGQRIRVEGCVIDGTGSPVKDVLIEVWQANGEGIYAHSEVPGDVPAQFLVEDLEPRGAGRQSDMHVRAGRLRGRFLEILRRVVSCVHDLHQLPSSRFSNIVERRPRSTMSKR